MTIKNISDPSFRQYGRIVEDIDFKELYAYMETSPCPTDRVIYEPSINDMENSACYEKIKNRLYGELSVQIGYCNGVNYKLNALEYHRSSEINIACTDAVLLLGRQQDISQNGTYDTALVEAFLVPKGKAVELYATTLHYAPCCAAKDSVFRVVVVLPKGTNYPLKASHCGGEDNRITDTNKWLVGHPQGGLPDGAPLGLTGENIDISLLL